MIVKRWCIYIFILLLLAVPAAGWAKDAPDLGFWRQEEPLLEVVDVSFEQGVIINIERGGPGLGSIQPSQSDYWQATRALGHGDYQMIVYAPCTVQEMSDLAYNAFDVADEYRTPVMILGDGMLGQMMEPVVLPER